LVWVGSNICEERDASNTVTKRYYAQGVQVGTANYFYSRDHLGSIHELTDSSGAVQVRYDYDPYGRRTKLSGSLDADFGFTGFYFHSASALNFSLTRVYDSDLGRWINRDPISELGGINLYGYVSNNPIIFIDPLGLLAAGLTGFLVDAGIATGVGITIATASPAVVLAALAIGAAILLTPTSIGPESSVGSLQSQSSMAPPGRPPCPPKAPAAAPDPGGGGGTDSGPMVTVVGSGSDVARYAGRPGFNVLDMSEIPEAEWPRANAEWLNAAMQRGDTIWLVTDPAVHAQLMLQLGKSSYFLDLELPMLEEFGADVVPNFTH
jgi:RHS repeat-associated protein